MTGETTQVRRASTVRHALPIPVIKAAAWKRDFDALSRPKAFIDIMTSPESHKAESGGNPQSDSNVRLESLAT